MRLRRQKTPLLHVDFYDHNSVIPATSEQIEGVNNYVWELNADNIFVNLCIAPPLLVLFAWATYYFDEYTYECGHICGIKFNNIVRQVNYISCHAVNLTDNHVFPSLLRMCGFHSMPNVILKTAVLPFLTIRIMALAMLQQKAAYLSSNNFYTRYNKFMQCIIYILVIFEISMFAIFVTGNHQLDNIHLHKLFGIAFAASATFNMLVAAHVVAIIRHFDRLAWPPISELILMALTFMFSAPLALPPYFYHLQHPFCTPLVDVTNFIAEFCMFLGYTLFHWRTTCALFGVKLCIFGTPLDLDYRDIPRRSHLDSDKS